jgi:hypothetical protein
LTLLELLTEPERGQLLDLSAILEARVALIEDPRERHILRARYLTRSPEKLRALADQFGVSVGRIHQLEQRALKSAGKMLPQSSAEELALFYLSNSPPPPGNNTENPSHCPIDDWLDTLTRLFPLATQRDRIMAHRLADKLRALASDFNLNRVKTALNAGLTVGEIADQLGLLTEAVEHLRQLVDWRYGHENRYTLTEAGLKAIKQVDAVSDAA